MAIRKLCDICKEQMDKREKSCYLKIGSRSSLATQPSTYLDVCEDCLVQIKKKIVEMEK